MPVEVFITLIVGTVMLSPVMIISMVLRHRERLIALKQRGENAPPGLAEEVAALRRELTALRETTTKFDMSFDAALQRVEDRMDALEQDRPQERYRTTAVLASETETILRPR